MTAPYLSAYQFVVHCLNDMDWEAIRDFEEDCAIITRKFKIEYRGRHFNTIFDSRGWPEHISNLTTVLYNNFYHDLKDPPWTQLLERKAQERAMAVVAVTEVERACDVMIAELERMR